MSYGRLSFNQAITHSSMRANTNLLCSKQLSFGGFVDVDLEKLAGAATGMVRGGPIGGAPSAATRSRTARLRTRRRSPWA